MGYRNTNVYNSITKIYIKLIKIDFYSLVKQRKLNNVSGSNIQ